MKYHSLLLQAFSTEYRAGELITPLRTRMVMNPQHRCKWETRSPFGAQASIRMAGTSLPIHRPRYVSMPCHIVHGGEPTKRMSIGPRPPSSACGPSSGSGSPSARNPRDVDARGAHSRAGHQGCTRGGTMSGLWIALQRY